LSAMPAFPLGGSCYLGLFRGWNPFAGRMFGFLPFLGVAMRLTPLSPTKDSTSHSLGGGIIVTPHVFLVASALDYKPLTTSGHSEPGFLRRDVNLSGLSVSRVFVPMGSSASKAAQKAPRRYPSRPPAQPAAAPHRSGPAYQQRPPAQPSYSKDEGMTAGRRVLGALLRRAKPSAPTRPIPTLLLARHSRRG